jgi:glycosyltransferase involved in cell wall biosynthesis
MTLDPVGGVFTYGVELARALGRHGVRVSLATMGARLRRDQSHCLARLGNVDAHESTFQLEWMEEPWRDVSRAGDWLAGLEARLGPDLVHLNGYVHAARPWRVPVVVVGHSCVCCWWRAVRRRAAPEPWARYRAAVAAGLSAADAVVAPTRAALDDLCREYGPIPRARVVPNAREPRALPPRPKRPFVLYAGRLWDEAKNVQALQAVAGRLPWPVCVAGDAQPPGGRRVPLDGLWVLGALAPVALAQWFGRAAIYALPARYEPFGLSALEAGLAGCALVLGDIPSLREVWGEAAVFVDPEDPEALAAALRRLIADEQARGRLASLARARALEFSPERMAEGYLAAYRAARRGGAGATTPIPEEAPACGS